MNQREALNFDLLYKKFTEKYSLNQLNRVTGISVQHLEKIIDPKEDVDPSILFYLVWIIEIILDPQIIKKIQKLRMYLGEWKEKSLVITELDEGVLEEKDIEQLSTIGKFLDNDLERIFLKIKEIQS